MLANLEALLARGDAIFKFDPAEMTPGLLHSNITTDDLGDAGHALHAAPSLFKPTRTQRPFVHRQHTSPPPQAPREQQRGHGRHLRVRSTATTTFLAFQTPRLV